MSATSEEGKKIIKVVQDGGEMSLEETGYDAIELTTPPMPPGPNEAHDPVLRNKAYMLYMANWPYKKICSEIKLPYGTLLTWITRGNWSELRRQNAEILATDIRDANIAGISQIAHDVIDGLSKAIRRDSGSNGFKTKDIPAYAAILANLDKLCRLNHGLPTSISEERSKRAQFVLPMDQLKNITQVKVHDPFAVEAEKDEAINEPKSPTDS